MTKLTEQIQRYNVVHMPPKGERTMQPFEHGMWVRTTDHLEALARLSEQQAGALPDAQWDAIEQARMFIGGIERQDGGLFDGQLEAMRGLHRILAQRAPVPAPKWFLPEDDVRLGRQIVVTVNGDYSTTKPAPGPPNVGSACGHPTQEQIESWNTHRIPDVSLQGIAPAPQSTEDVVDRMQHAYLDAVEVSEHNACKTGTVCSVGMTAALAEARRGMYNEAEIEKIVEVLKEMEEIYRDVRSAEIDSFTLQPVRLLLARLSAREQPSKEQPVI